jgi:hypothetical protein
MSKISHSTKLTLFHISTCICMPTFGQIGTCIEVAIFYHFSGIVSKNVVIQPTLAKKNPNSVDASPSSAIEVEA